MTGIGWAAAVCGASGAWLVAAQSRRGRFAGFALFLTSNVLWLGWSLHGHEWEVLTQTVVFTVTSLRGLWLNRCAGTTREGASAFALGERAASSQER